MSTAKLPDFSTAPAWMDAAGNAWATTDIIAEVGPGCIAESNAPWTPLDTAGEWVKRIDRDKLARLIEEFTGGDASRIADAVAESLPDLMGGGER